MTDKPIKPVGHTGTVEEFKEQMISAQTLTPRFIHPPEKLKPRLVVDNTFNGTQKDKDK